MSDQLVLGARIGLAALVMDREGGLAILEEELLPVVEEVDGDAVFFAQVGNSDLLDEVFPKEGDLLLGGEGPTLAGHGCSSARVLPLTLTKATSGFDWGNTRASSCALSILIFKNKLRRSMPGFKPRVT